MPEECRAESRPSTESQPSERSMTEALRHDGLPGSQPASISAAEDRSASSISGERRGGVWEVQHFPGPVGSQRAGGRSSASISGEASRWATRACVCQEAEAPEPAMRGRVNGARGGYPLGATSCDASAPATPPCCGEGRAPVERGAVRGGALRGRSLGMRRPDLANRQRRACCKQGNWGPSRSRSRAAAGAAMGGERYSVEGAPATGD